MAKQSSQYDDRSDSAGKTMMGKDSKDPQRNEDFWLNKV